jgi:hypothetical protein
LPPDTEYQVSATYLAANLSAIRQLGHGEALLAALRPELRATAEAPSTQSWWPGAVNEQLLRALATVKSDAVVEEVGFLSVQNSIGPIVMPLLKVLLALTGSDPATLFSRLGLFLSSSARGVKPTWKLVEPTLGELSISYPVNVDPVLGTLWHGGLRCALTLLKRDGMITTRLVTDRSLSFLISWR